MIRKFVTLEGEVLEEADWRPRLTDECFYCGSYLIGLDTPCDKSQDGNHDWITLTDPSYFE